MTGVERFCQNHRLFRKQRVLYNSQRQAIDTQSIPLTYGENRMFIRITAPDGQSRVFTFYTLSNKLQVYQFDGIYDVLL